MTPHIATFWNIFEDWCVVFHGTRLEVLPTILAGGGLMKPGDTLITGKKLKALNSAGRQKDGVRDKHVFSLIQPGTNRTLNTNSLFFRHYISTTFVFV